MYNGNELVSVVLTTYNRERTLLNAVNSVLTQTYANIQLIIVDDGSTDDTKAILSNLSDNRIEIIYLPENRHISYATDKGFEYIKGDFVAIMDSDDRWKRNKLERQLEYMKNHPEHMGCFTWADVIDQNGEYQNEKHFIYKCMISSHTDTREAWLRFFFFNGNKLVNPSSMVRTEAARAIGKHNTFMTQALDMDWWVRFTKKYSFGIIEEPLVDYCISDDSVSGSKDEDDSRRIRFYNELMQIRYHFFDDMDSELFIRAFRDFFVCKDSCTEDELKCEQAFLILKPFEMCHTNSAVALLKFEELMNNPSTEELLWNKYKFGTTQIAQYTGMNLYYDCIAEKEKERCNDLKKEILHINELKCKVEQYNEQLNRRLQESEQEIKHLRHINDILHKEFENAADSLNEVINSSSWKITAPLRRLKDKAILRKNKFGKI